MRRSTFGRAEGFGLLIPVAISPLLTAATNHVAGRILDMTAPWWGGIATAAVPSCIMIVLLYAAFGDRRALDWPRPDRATAGRAARLAATWWVLWLAGCIVFATATGRWVTYAHATAGLTAFLLCGPVGEELLFRGLVYEQVRRLRFASARDAIWISTLAFSLHHGVLATAPPSLLWMQILFTIPMGWVFATLRERTASLWPGLLLHIATNFPAAV